MIISIKKKEVTIYFNSTSSIFHSEITGPSKICIFLNKANKYQPIKKKHLGKTARVISEAN